ncbi:MAG: type VI secretion system tip protein VgrG [Paracoccaceae bacterium]|nr:MAG: type VI secretion system tip protein VgrG [Paracoccaceae bacterium]
MSGGGISQVILENRKIKMDGPLGPKKMFIKSARVVEALSTVTETTIDFMSPDQKVDLGQVVGRTIKVMVQKGEEGGDAWREFVGTCIEAQYMGLHEGFGFYSLEVRPWIWFLTRSSGCRIFQNQSATDIIKKIFSDRGFSDYTVSVNRSLEPRIYTVQYNETDYDFISRLMEEEGIYFFSTVKNGVDHLMIVDDIGAHQPVQDFPTIEFATREQEYRRTTDHIFEWRGSENVTSGKVTLRDYNFEKPKADMTTVKSTPKGSHSHKNYELYGYSGHYRETALGDEYARIRMQAEAVKFQVRNAIGNVRTLATGATFKLDKHKRDAENQDYLITGAVHMLQIEVQMEDETQQVKELPGTIEFDEKNKDSYRCTFQTIPKNVPYRAPFKTEWPKIPGILLAKVTGPGGEEIYTDKYGRIKVQFPWDREGKNDENTTCWVRVVTPWSGKNWGMIHIPRIGQEVVIQFEDGDPDRPICTGMLYNADTMPPYELPANMTMQGIKTNSSKGGGGFNELVFEDKKDEEYVRLQSEKDYFEIIKNNATITIGLEKQDDGDITTTIHRNRTETIKTGDLTLTVEQGNEKRDIKTDRTEKVGQHATQEVGGNKTMKVTGNYEGSTGGNSSATVSGNSEESVTGTFKSTVTGPITIESSASIELKVMGSSIKIDPSGVTIKGPMITTEAQGIAQHKGSGMVIIQGGLVMIN